MDILSSSSGDDQNRAHRLQKEVKHKAENLGELRIIIVDDEFFVAWHIESMLGEMGYTDCNIANDSRTAIDLAVSREADLLLMDVNLGAGPDGVETVRRIFGRRDVLVIFITAYTDHDNLRRIREVAPGAPVLAKPMSFGLLQTTISRLFQSN